MDHPVKRPKCRFCCSPYHRPEDLFAFPSVQPPAYAHQQEWACGPCLDATRAMDRTTRSRYIRLGIIRPATVLEVPLDSHIE